MKLKINTFSAVTLLLSVAAMPAIAATSRTELLGDAATPSVATKTIMINANTKYVNITGGDTVLFKVGDKMFAWQFDGRVSKINLSDIAPAGVLDHNVTAYVSNDPQNNGA
jgi:Heavy-metal resistance protein CzcE